jgi:transcription initiation factor TFIIIB Brf1 subunit/transcription initiation factor TFIIB
MEMSQALALDEEVREKIWNIVKIQLSVETHLLVNRMIDQMVMCAIYGVCKVQPGMQITFN